MERTYSHIDLDERRKRNMFVDQVVPDLNGYYRVTAHDMACERGRNSGSWYASRMSGNPRSTGSYTVGRRSRMRLEWHPISVSHESIYKFAYSADGHAIKLWR